MGKKAAYTFGQDMAKLALFGDPAIALGGWSDQGKATSKATAEGLKKVIDQSSRSREETPLQYIFNPAVFGPLTEIYQRLARRHYASAAENPHLTGWLPLYGMLMGGKAGTPR